MLTLPQVQVLVIRLLESKGNFLKTFLAPLNVTKLSGSETLIHVLVHDYI